MSFSSKDSNPRGTSALTLIKVALGMDSDSRIRCTTYVPPLSSVRASSKLLLCFVDFAAALDSVDRDSFWRIMAADGMPPTPELLRLIRTYYASTKMKIRASGSDSMSFEIRSGVRQGHAPILSNYIINWIIGQALQPYPGV